MDASTPRYPAFSPALLNAPPASHPFFPPLPRDLPLTLFAAPAFFGISAPADNRAEAGAPRPNPGGLSPQPSRSILSQKAAGRTASAGNALCACARRGRAGPGARTSAPPPGATPAGGREEDSSLQQARAGPPRPGKVAQETKRWGAGLPHTSTGGEAVTSGLFPSREERTRSAQRQVSSRSRSQPAGADRAQQVGVDRASCPLSPWVLSMY